MYTRMSKTHDCFKIEVELKERAKQRGRDEGTNKSIIYRKAIIEYLDKPIKKDIKLR